jgi:outer membrane protein OmpA-like peptidoglycan-associated protein
MRTWVLVVSSAVLGCASQPAPRMKLERVVLYQNGIGYFERSGHVGSDRIELPFAVHEVDDVLKTLTVIDKRGAAMATVDVPEIKPKERTVSVGVRITGGGAHDVQVTYAIPTPTWKAAYRVVLDGKASDTATGLLQGWAVVDNVSPEDWTNVRLTLATGAPVSYALDLKTPQYVERPDVTGRMVKPAVLGAVEAEKAGAGAGDKDGDGIANQDDLCPDEPEDKDGFEDDDGCPDPDNDKDRIPDRLDKCPNEPETYNGFEDEDGCPDRGRVVVTDTAIEILDRVYFPAKTSKLDGRSLPIIDATAATLKGNPSILLVEVQGHAAQNEPDKHRLAEQRADAVKAALVQRGVAPSRLLVRGYGATQPFDRASNERAWAKNRRVDFLILKRASDDDESGPARRPQPVVIDTQSAQASVKTATRPVEVAGAVRYELAEPVTIRRHSSTMVSILNKPITAEDVYLWRPDANAPGSDKYPFRAVRMVNSSGFTLQPGSLAIFARGTFVGDSLMASLGRDETAWVPYALDSSTSVSVETDDAEQPVRIVAIERGLVRVENAGTLKTTYTIAASREPAARMFVRHRKSRGYTAHELPPGTIDQGDAYLVPVSLLAAKTSVLVVEERQSRRRSFELSGARAGEVAVYIAGSALPAPLDKQLREAIELRTQLSRHQEELDQLLERQANLGDRTYELRENIKTLDKVATAADLRRKLVASLAQATTESEKLAKEIAARTEIAAAARTRLTEAIRELALEEPATP